MPIYFKIVIIYGVFRIKLNGKLSVYKFFIFLLNAILYTKLK